MGDRENMKSVWAPFSPLNLALSAASEVGIRAASDTLGIPQGAGLVFSVGAGASVEVVGNWITEAKRILRTAHSSSTDNPLPEAVRKELTKENIADAIQLIESNEVRMTQLVYQRAEKNPAGLRPGISLIHVV